MADRNLPSKVVGYLRRLQGNYKADATDSFRQSAAQLLAGAKCYVREGSHTHQSKGEGHTVIIFAPIEALAGVDISWDENIREMVKRDLNVCASGVLDEYIARVAFEPAEESDPEFQLSHLIVGSPVTSPDSVSFWRPGCVRVFLSHRDKKKVQAHILADALENYGISTFVAHDTIEPMSAWRHEVQKGLETMEVMLAFITDDFDESPWTHQEIGFALGRGVPIISLQMEIRSPSGFLEATQALKGYLENPAPSAEQIYALLAEKLGNLARLQAGLVTAFVNSPDFNETRDRFDRMNKVVQKLTEAELRQILDGFRDNSQLFNAGHLTSKHSRLVGFLNRTTGRHFEVVAPRRIREIVEG